MRIHLPTIWTVLGATFSIVAAEDGEPSFQFEGRDFVGEFLSAQSSVFQYSKIANGKTFRWNETTGRLVDIVRVELMNVTNSSILLWCPPDNTCNITEGFDVQVEKPLPWDIILYGDAINRVYQHLREVLFFRVDWRSKDGKRDLQQTNSAYSQEWAVVEGEGADAVFTPNARQMTAGADPARPSGAAPSTATNTETYGATALATSTPISTSAAAPTGNSGNNSGGLTTGAIVGIVVGTVGGLILVSVVAGCFCFRRRRDAGVERGGSRGVQDIIAEKEAHASILDRDQPDTPYSEQNSQHPLHRGLGLAGRNESGVDLGIGQAMSGEGCGSVRTESLHTVAGGGNNRNSVVYSSLGGAAGSAHGTPVIGSGAFASSPPTHAHTPSMSVHDRSSAMGSPVPRASSQLDRSLSPYRDNAGSHDYGQHHHVVDGADLVQQEHSNDGNTVRSTSSIYSSNPLDELQPISPDSAREDAGAAGGGGGGGGGASSHGPPGHGRSNTPSGISGQYAHLVEEGMTDDEIRRLEEEERVLDEAIEQAGSAGRTR